jgi:signal transduction histidine kinase
MLVVAGVLTGLTLLACVTIRALSEVNEHHRYRMWQAGDARQTAHQIGFHLLAFNRVSALVMLTHNPGRERERTSEAGMVYNQLEKLHAVAEPSLMPIVDRASDQIQEYFAACHQADLSGARAESDLVSLAPLVDTAQATLKEVADAEDSRIAGEAQAADRWNRIAVLIGSGVSVLVVLGSVGALLGLYRLAIRPTIELTESIKRFGEGDREARAGTTASLELASAARTFNELADVISGQHSRMLDFLGAVTRDLRDPVGIIRTSLAQLERGRPLPPEEKIRLRVDTIGREVERLDRLIDNFLDASRIEWQRLDLQQARRDIRGVLSEVVQVYETFSSAHHVSLSAPDEPVWVRFDTERLMQVLHALMSSAIQRSPGGGDVDVKLTAGEDDTPEAIIDVVDHGLGLSPEQTSHLFEPFVEVQGPRPPSASTTWVALSVARRIVDAHGGRIEAESAVGRGTTVRVHLPLETAPSMGEAAQTPASVQTALAGAHR